MAKDKLLSGYMKGMITGTLEPHHPLALSLLMHPEGSLSSTVILGTGSVRASSAGHLSHPRGHIYQKAVDSCLQPAGRPSCIHSHRVVKTDVPASRAISIKRSIDSVKCCDPTMYCLKSHPGMNV